MRSLKFLLMIILKILVIFLKIIAIFPLINKKLTSEESKKEEVQALLRKFDHSPYSNDCYKISSSIEKISKLSNFKDSIDHLKQFQIEKKAMFQATKEKLYYVNTQ